jgi:hypothetical protein
MKKEYLFFLVLVLAAAIVTGATIGFVSSFHNIQQQAQENISQVQATEQQALEKSDRVKNDNGNAEVNDNEVTNVAITQYAAPITEQGYLVLSREEKQQIVDMLVSLGATKDGDYSTFIRNFQKEKLLPPTGNLDSLTLNAIINEVTRQRAAQIVNG